MKNRSAILFFITGIAPIIIYLFLLKIEFIPSWYRIKSSIALIALILFIYDALKLTFRVYRSINSFRYVGVLLIVLWAGFSIYCISWKLNKGNDYFYWNNSRTLVKAYEFSTHQTTLYLFNQNNLMSLEPFIMTRNSSLPFMHEELHFTAGHFDSIKQFDDSLVCYAVGGFLKNHRGMYVYDAAQNRGYWRVK